MPAGKDENRFTIIPNHGTLRSGECSVVVEKDREGQDRGGRSEEMEEIDRGGIVEREE